MLQMPASAARCSSTACQQVQPDAPSTACLQVHVSYLEIYNQTGFDLLDPNREIKAMEDLPQIAQRGTFAPRHFKVISKLLLHDKESRKQGKQACLDPIFAFHTERCGSGRWKKAGLLLLQGGKGGIETCKGHSCT
eukprot:1146490-Pelagomonas_calceolata.AAC.7